MSPLNDGELRYQLLDQHSSSTTLAFWVKNETDANNPEFINAMLLETMRGPERVRINPLFSLALSKPSTHTSFGVFPAKEGGWGLHIRCEA